MAGMMRVNGRERASDEIATFGVGVGVGVTATAGDADAAL
jgi:hypothetical protein